MKIIKLEIKFEVEIEACESIAKQFQLAVDRKITLNWLHCDTEEFGEAFDLILDKALDDNLGLEVKILDIEEWDASIPTATAISATATSRPTIRTTRPYSAISATTRTATTTVVLYWAYLTHFLCKCSICLYN
jgi:hypothetical protein